MNSLTSRTVRDLAMEIPGATRVFEQLGIDYCCGGNRSLADACQQAGVAVEKALDSLELETEQTKGEQPAFLPTATLDQLIDHIVSKHHTFTKSELIRLQALIEKVCHVHAQNHPELEQLRALFQSLSAELGPHMMKEENVLFPFVIGMEKARERQVTFPTPPFGTVLNPIRMMTLEHETAGELLRGMRAVSANYTVPSDACISYQTLYEALIGFEQDLHQHIHLENNILFPRALEIEGQE